MKLLIMQFSQFSCHFPLAPNELYVAEYSGVQSCHLGRAGSHLHSATSVKPTDPPAVCTSALCPCMASPGSSTSARPAIVTSSTNHHRCHSRRQRELAVPLVCYAAQSLRTSGHVAPCNTDCCPQHRQQDWHKWHSPRFSCCTRGGCSQAAGVSRIWSLAGDVLTGSGAHPANCSKGTGCYFPGNNAAGA
jgi:hypothetical protein